jgi:hypothetical protein
VGRPRALALAAALPAMAAAARAAGVPTLVARPPFAPRAPAASRAPRRAGARAPPPPPRAAGPAADAPIEGLQNNFCDDFECTSSPAIESTVRALARDIGRANGVWTRSLLSRSVEYSDASLRRFKGPGGYGRLDFIPKRVANARAVVTSMRMLDIGTAVVAWRLTGSLGPLPLDVACEDEFQLNLLTGQVERHAARWDTHACAPAAAAAWRAARAAAAAAAAGADAADAVGRAVDALTSSDSDAEDGGGFSADPSDPQKFFQQGDSFKEEATTLIIAVALLYAVWVGFSTVLK